MGDKAPSRHTELPFAIDLSLHPHLQPKTEQTHAEAYVAQFELFNHLISNDSAFVNPEEEEAEEVEE